ncbi:MAG: endonuclease/exonuclease/phosphatase family protein, partial [Bacteroidales bacterium]|nr:endonuclease/exonuclease/phosphatase family protein [Bacteroidales bacterium]
MRHLFFICGIFLFLACEFAFAQEKKEYKVGTIAFYNLENLFDTLPGPNDKEFTPDAPKNWNTKKYFEKIDRMGKVIVQIGADFTGTAPMVVGVSEVENITPLNDLVNSESMKPYGYKIVHIDGPDRRGVDCALLYRPEYFKVTNVRMHKVVSEQEGFITRDQIVVSGLYDGEEMHFIVLHWPS